MPREYPKVQPRSRGTKAKRAVLSTERITLKKGKCSLGQQKTAILIAFMLKNVSYRMEATWDWLRTKNGINMYADIYFPSHNLIVEFHGEQHYTYPNFFHKTKKAFTDAQHRDTLKKALIEEHGMRYIEWKYNIPHIQKRAYDLLVKAGIPLKEIRKPRSPKSAKKGKTKEYLKIMPKRPNR